MTRKSKIKRMLALAGAFLIGMSSFIAVPNVAAEGERDAQDGLVSTSTLPDDTELAVNYYDEIEDMFETEDEYAAFYYGGDAEIFEMLVTKENEMMERYSEDELKEGSETFYQAIAELFEVSGIYPYATSEGIREMHLEKNGQKISYSGDGITIRYNFGLGGDFFEIGKKINEYSEHEWYYAIVHVKDDGSREYLPATVDDDGVTEFTTTDFSLFYPAFVMKAEEEAPKTLDGTFGYVGIAIGATGIFVLGAWLSRKERR